MERVEGRGRPTLKVTRFFIWMAALGIIVPPLHEIWGHLAVALGLKGGGWAESAQWGFAGWYHFAGQLPPHGELIYFAGGLVVFVLLMACWIWFYRSVTLWDMGEEMAVFFWAIVSLFYGITEGLMGFDIIPYERFFLVSGITTGVGALAAVLIYIFVFGKRIEKWLFWKEEYIWVEGKARLVNKVVGTLVFAGILGCIAGSLNQWFQDIFCKAAGGQSQIEKIFWGVGQDIHFVQLPANHAWTINLAGLAVFLIFFAFWIWPYLSKTRGDLNIELPLAAWGIAELSYGAIKLWSHFHPGWTFSETILTILPLATAIIVVGLYLPTKYVPWLTEKEVINRRIPRK